MFLMIHLSDHSCKVLNVSCFVYDVDLDIISYILSDDECYFENMHTIPVSCIERVFVSNV